jgi:dTDP-4-amino-4,6-dideoxygalactose transaminase
LQLAFYLFPKRGKVLTTPSTCFATTAAILTSGCRPKWVDVNPVTCNMNLDDLDSKFDQNVVAISAVHFAGRPVDLDRLRKYGVPVIDVASPRRIV